MTLVNTTVNVTPTNTNEPIVPSSNPTLNPPYNETAVCNLAPATPELTFTCTVDIPTEVAWSDVQVLQYYNSSNADTVEIYFVYNISGGSGKYNSYTVEVALNNTDANGRDIVFNNITKITSLIEDIDPKTSRGTRTVVQRVGGI